MNKLKAQITEINTSGEISLITLLCEAENFYALIINNNETYIKIDNPVLMVFKETEVSIGKGLNGKLSIRNTFRSKIISVSRGQLLSEVKLDYKGHEIISIITTASADRLELTAGDDVEGLLKTNELLLMRYD